LEDAKNELKEEAKNNKGRTRATSVDIMPDLVGDKIDPGIGWSHVDKKL
jgi:hypothetical protein